MNRDSSLTGTYEPLDGIIAEYLQAVEAGTAPSREEWLARHPELADRLRAFFADFDAVGRDASKFRLPDPQATMSVGGSGRSDLPKVRYLGDYELLDEIARGGMGVVYRARQVSLNRTVALKMILAGTYATELAVQRFRAEAEAAANLDHPNILPIYEVGEHEGHQYFSMKLVEGGSLSGKVEELRKQPKLIATLMATLAKAVHFAHQRGILHRDLKPSNILLDPDGTPYVTDFGLAKKVNEDDGSTRTGSIIGTPSYMAPEQARGEKGLTTSVDIYSLGAILYELLTGKPPFKGETVFATVKQVLEQEPAKPEGDRDLGVIALKCLSKDPAKRYASAGEMADDLERWTRGEAIQARQINWIEKGNKWISRNPAVSGLAAAFLLAVIGGTALSIRYALLADKRAEQATNAENEALQQKVTVEHREEAIKDLLAGSTFEQAQSRRLAGLAGWKARNLELLESSVRMSLRPMPTNPTGIARPNIADLRGEFINASSRIDCELKREIPRRTYSKVFSSGDGRRHINFNHSTNPAISSASARIHDILTGREVSSKVFTTSEEEASKRAATWLAVDHEGKRGVSKPAGDLQIVDLESLSILVTLPKLKNLGNFLEYVDVAFSPDGLWLAVAVVSVPESNTPFARWYLWNTDGKSPAVLLQELKVEGGSYIRDRYRFARSLAFSPDGKTLALLSPDKKELRLHNPAKQPNVGETWLKSETTYGRFAWRPDSKGMVIAEVPKPGIDDVRVSLYERGSLTPKRVEGSYRGNLELAFRRDGMRLAIASLDRVAPVTLIEATNGKLIGQIQSQRSDGHLVEYLDWTPGGDLVTYHLAEKTQVWSLKEHGPEWYALSPFRVEGELLTSPCGRYLLATVAGEPDPDEAWRKLFDEFPVSRVQSAMIDLTTGKELWRKKIDFADFAFVSANQLAFSPDGNQFAYTTLTDVKVLDVATGKELKRFKADATQDSTWSGVMYSPAGVLLGIRDLGVDKPKEVEELESGKKLGRLPQRQAKPKTGQNAGDPAEEVELDYWNFHSSPDGSRLFSRKGSILEKLVPTDNPWTVIEVPSLKTLTSFPGGVEMMPNTIASSRDGSRLVGSFIPMGSKDGIQTDKAYWLCWDTTTGKVLLQGDDKFGSLGATSISPDGRWIVSIVDVNDVIVWNVDQAKIFARWKPFDGKRVGTACFTTDGKLNLAAADDERLLRLEWDSMLKQLGTFGLGDSQ